MSKNAASATTPISHTTPAATDIARNVRTRNGQNGWKTGRLNCYPWNIFTWYSPFRRNWPVSPSTTKRVVYGILFRAAAETLLTIARDPKHLGAEIGFFGVLHTWGQNLQHHPHVHCVVPGGGISPDHERWISCPPGFFLSVHVLSRLFRRLFLDALEDAFYTGKLRFFGETEFLQDAIAFAECLASQESREWVVYAKQAFGGPQQALEYLGRYTHRVAISNDRLLAVNKGEVTFQWKDYRTKHKQNSRVMTLGSDEFIRRFLGQWRRYVEVLSRGQVRPFGCVRGRRCRHDFSACGILAFSLTGIAKRSWTCAESC